MDPLNRFVPTEPFRDFVANDRDRMIVVRAANRVGKTYQTAYKVAKYMVGHADARCRVIGPTKKQVNATSARYLAEFVAPYLSRRSYYVNGKGFNSDTVMLQNGAICQLRSCEDTPNSHAGDEFDIVWGDEPLTKAHFSENLARVVSRNGQFIATFTAVNRPVSWFRKLVEVDQPDRWKQYVVPFRAEHVPWYTPEMVEAHLAAMRSSMWTWQQRVEASWEGMSEGRLFACFTEENVVKRPPTEDVSIGIGIDHGTVAGHQVAVLVAYRGTTVWVVDEYVSEWSTSPDQDAGAILDMLRRNGLGPEDVNVAVGDTNYHGGYRANTLIEQGVEKRIGSRRSFRIRNADKSPGSVDYGYRVLNYASDRNELKVVDSCISVLDTMRNWRGGTKFGTTDASLSHAADAIRYVCVGILEDMPQYRRLRIQ